MMSYASVPRRRWAKNCALASGTGKRVMLRMPASTAEMVTCAALPASSGTLTVTGKGCSGRICLGADKPTATRRALRSIGT